MSTGEQSPSLDNHMSEPYIYDSLPTGHVRLLTLTSPATQLEQLTWSLQTVPLPSQNPDTAIAFEALSYTWGDLRQTYPLICDGRELRIHHGLHTALPYLARRPSSLPLWIDAVCINQSIDSEKLVQIRLMSEIYQSASHVWVWLGAAEEPAAREAVTTLFPKLREIHETIEALPERFTVEPAHFGLPGYDSPAWTALEKILKSPWFLRLWIVQEAALAREITCLFGHHTIDWNELDDALYHARDLRAVKEKDGSRLTIHEDPIVQNNNVFRARKVYQNWLANGGEDFEPVTNMLLAVRAFTTHSQCSEARDRVIALVGLLGKNHQNDIKFDGKMSVVELYCEFMQFIFHADPRYLLRLPDDLLRLAFGRDQSTLFPSWCPDFHKKHIPQDTINWNRLEKPKFNWRASTARPQSRRGRTNRELVLRGTVVDIVKSSIEPLDGYVNMYEPPPTPGESLLFFFRIREWESAASTLASTVIGKVAHGPAAQDTAPSEFVEEDYWGLLTGGAPSTLKVELSFNNFLEFRNALSSYSSILELLGPKRSVQNPTKGL